MDGPGCDPGVVWVCPYEDAGGDKPVVVDGCVCWVWVPGDDSELECGFVGEEEWEQGGDVDLVVWEVECGDSNDWAPEAWVDATGEDGCEWPGDAGEVVVDEELDFAEGGVAGEGVVGAEGGGEGGGDVGVPEFFVGVAGGGDGDEGADGVWGEGDWGFGGVLGEVEVGGEVGVGVVG